MEEIKLSITLLNDQLQPAVNAKRKGAGQGPCLAPHLSLRVHRGILLALPPSTNPTLLCLSSCNSPRPGSPLSFSSPCSSSPQVLFCWIRSLLMLTASHLTQSQNQNSCKDMDAHAPVISSLLFFYWPLSSAAHCLLAAHRNLQKVSLVSTPYGVCTH